MPYATAPDGCRLHFELLGPADGPALMIGYPWNDGMAHMMGEMAGDMSNVAAQVELNHAFVEQFTDRYRVVFMDYPRGLAPTEGPLEGDLTPDTAASDYLTIADAAGVERFVALGYSWSATAGLQVASRTDRCAGLALGGWPPLSAPYELLLEQVRAQAAVFGPDEDAGRFIRATANWYEAIVGHWDEEAAVAKLTGPRISFFGADDDGVPDMGLPVPLAELTRSRRADLEALGWNMRELEGHDHMTLTTDPALVASTIREVLDQHDW